MLSLLLRGKPQSATAAAQEFVVGGAEGSVGEHLLASAGQSLTSAAAAAQDFAEVLARPRLVVLGAGLQYTVMPLMGLAVSRAAGLAAPLAVG